MNDPITKATSVFTSPQVYIYKGYNFRSWMRVASNVSYTVYINKECRSDRETLSDTLEFIERNGNPHGDPHIIL